jgi:hypothetical protein
MANPDGSRVTSARFSPETQGARSPTPVAKGPPLLGSGPHAPSASRFAAYLDGRAKEVVPAKLGGSALPSHRAAQIGIDVSDLPHDSERSAGRAETEADDVAVGREATLDPMMQVLGPLAPRHAAPCATARSEPPVLPDARTSMEQLMAKLVRRVAWSGNGRNGVARLELGAGELEGATLTIQADDGLVRVALDVPPGVDRDAWKARISDRLALRGLQVEAVDVA